MNSTRKDTRRLIVSAAILVAVPCYIFCGLHHICMAGHMKHPPYPTLAWLNDGSWIAAMVIAAVLSWNSNLRLRRSALAILALLLTSRLLLGSGGGFFFLIELPLVICLTLAAIIGLWSPDKDRSNWSQEEHRSHRRKLLRNWGMGMGILAFAVIAAYAGIHIRNFLRDQSAPRIGIAATAIPFTREIVIEPGKAVVLILPNNKTLAIWCERHSGIESVIAESALGMHYGEKPFTRLEYERIPLPSGGTTSGEWLSYIRQGEVIGWSGKPKEYILYVDPYRISLKQKDITSSIRLLATVTQASEEEQVGPKQEVDYFASRLKDPNPDVRLDAIRKLTDLLICGSIYAEPRETFIITQLKQLKEDSDPKVREHVADSLRSLGDIESILQAIQPQPAGRFLDTDEVRILGTSTKKCKEPAKLGPLYRHVLALFRSDQEELRKFAVLFFSFTEPVPEAREFLIKARRDPSPAVRAASAHTLDNLYDANLHDDDPSNDTQAREQAVEMLGDPIPEVVIAVLETSLHSGEHRQLPFHAVKPFLTSKHKGIRVAAIDAIYLINTAESERLLLAFTHDQDSDIRAAAAQSLSQARSAAVGVRMVQLLQDADTTVRIRALQGLDGGQHTSAISPIKALLADEKDPDVIRNANDALDHLKPRP